TNLGADLARVRRAVVSLMDAPEAAPVRPAPVALQCALCGRDLWDAERSVVGARGVVCSECVADAADALSRTTDRQAKLPPRPAGTPAPSNEALTEIAAAYEAGFAGDLDQIEDGPEIGPLGDEQRARHPGLQATFVVERVRMSGDDEAEVGFVIHVS